MPRLLVRPGQFFFRYRNALFPAFILLAVVFARPAWTFGNREADLAVDLAGLLVVLVGQVLRGLSVGYDYIVRGGRNRRVYADHLVTGGMFALCRNPLYLGNALIFAGFAIIFHSTVVYLLGVPLVVLVYATIIAAEEEFLRGKFGEAYEAYCRDVNRIWPRWGRFGEATKGMRFDWRKLVAKEHNTTFGWILGVLLLEAWTEYRIAGGAFLDKPQVVVLGVLFALTTIAYALVHAFKKAGAFS